MTVINRDIERKRLLRKKKKKKAVNAKSLLPIIISGKLDSFQKQALCA